MQKQEQNKGAADAATQAARIVVVGSLNMDVVLALGRVPEAGETVAAQSLSYLPGGKGGNQAVACARHGAQVTLFGSVGDDHHGESLLQGLRGDGVDVQHVSVHDGVPTGTAVIMVEPQGQNRICVVAGANALLTLHQDSLRPVLAQSDYLVLQFETPHDIVHQALLAAQAVGCKVVLNPSPVRDVPDDWWPLVHTLVVNEHEAAAFAGLPVNSLATSRAAALALLARGVKQVVVTLGSQGALAVEVQGDSPEFSEHAARRVDVVDTTAAGDTFLGAMVTRLAQGSTLAQAVPWGIRAASLCIGKAGAQPSIPTRLQVEEIL